MSCCKEGEDCNLLESVVSVDERGQLVLPKDLREKWGLKGGDKLAILTTVKGGEICCAALVKADLLTRNFKLKLDLAHEAQPTK
ncbi:MAG: AbrB/MazE/SpoVT family DNA-binding domain-containing protein [Candidatus Bathyarchaeota archaeon]|jgi:AbrB family looped-hinge helix DNA binding protein|nr:MAG: AbrB/MazE/SpoVT family DNA-binding domain-containing protein [Candidatus Bathyarchaeota archaeon]